MPRPAPTTADIKRYIRSPYAFPGGYEIVFITSDGCLLCYQCAHKNFREIAEAMKDPHDRTGFRITGIALECTSPEIARETSPDLISYCDQCSKEFGELD